MKRVDKLLGADVELGNFMQQPVHGTIGNDYAARALLAEIDGIPGRDTSPAYAYDRYYAGSAHSSAGPGDSNGYNPQDWGRKFLDTTGGCFYIDLGHLEACIPEVRSAHDFVAAHHANLRLARGACESANEKLLPGEQIVVMANNSDRMNNSWGGHLNVLVSRDLWAQVCGRMYPTLFVMVAFQVSFILFSGQGKAGAENGQPWVPFQISQRGDFFECITGLQTTHSRPLCNTRDEAHVGNGAAGADLARMHIIFHDTTLTHVSNYLKAGVTQLVLAMLEAGWCDTETVLEDPLSALKVWGHDPDLGSTAALFDGRRVTAVEHQCMFAQAARRFVEAGEAEQFVPEARAILELWEDTLVKLELRDFKALAPRLDWVMKKNLLERMISRNPDLQWDSPAIRAADLLFASLDPKEGLYWAVEAAGGAERIATQGEILRAMREPPVDTRAWSRTTLLRQVGRHGIESVNWDEIRLRISTPGDTGTIRFDDPRRSTRADMARRAEPVPENTAAHPLEPIAHSLEEG